MQTRRSTRSSVLGKRPRQPSPSPSPPPPTARQIRRPTRSSVLAKRPRQPPSSTDSKVVSELPTPDSTPNPKRVHVSLTGIEGDWNKENIAPFANADSSPVPTTPLRRTSTEYITPPRTRITPKRNASTSNIPTATPTPELSTPPPTPPTSLQPIHVRARAFLRATCNSFSTHIAGREVERDVITGFVREDDVDSSITTLYISGSPGTGKTALVNSVLCDFEGLTKILSINCMALNSVDELWDRIVEELGDGEKKVRGRKAKGREAVLKVLGQMEGRCILVLDELDHIATANTSLLSIFSLPNSSSPLRIIGIANTHTLTSSLSHSHKGVKTLHFAPYTSNQLLDILRARLQTLFECEGGGEATKRFLPQPTLTLLTKKIAAQTGDVRSLFEVLRGAIDLASTPTKSDPDSNPLDTPSPTVTPAHILAALKAHAPSSTPTRSSLGSSTSASSSASVGRGAAGGNSETASKVRNLGLQAQLVLLSILLASKRLDVGLSLSLNSSPPSNPKSQAKPKTPIKRSQSSPTGCARRIETTALHAHYITILTRASNEAFTPVTRSEFGDVLGTLEVVGLVSSTTSSASGGLGSVGAGSPVKRTFGRSASFGGVKGGGGGGMGVGGVKVAEGVRVDEVLRGLGVDVEGQNKEGKNIREEEIYAIWEREKGRLGRDVRVLEARGGVVAGGRGGGGGMFVDAMED